MHPVFATAAELLQQRRQAGSDDNVYVDGEALSQMRAVCPAWTGAVCAAALICNNCMAWACAQVLMEAFLLRSDVCMWCVYACVVLM